MLRSRYTCAVVASVLLVSAGFACGAFGGSDSSSPPAADAGADDGGNQGDAAGDAGWVASEDAGSVDAHDPCADAGPHRFMFVTNATFRGDLARDAGTTGREVADQRCNEAARVAGLPGTYVAWLSTTSDHPAVLPRPKVAIVLPRACEVLAADYSALTGLAGLPVAPSATEYGGTLASPCYVWSNTTMSGTSSSVNAPQDTTCGDWTRADPDASGYVGACANVDYEWTTFGDLPCNNANAHLYCLEN